MNVRQLRAPLLVLVALWIGMGAFVWATFDQLPERVATHFGLGGAPNGWMTRSGHVKFIMGFTIGLPVFLHLLFVGIRALGGTGCNIPNRQYWLAPGRQEATLAYVQQKFAWFICLLVAFFAGIHYVILNANTRAPATLSWPLFSTVLGSFLLLQLVWLALLLIPFLRVPKSIA
jgi:uncharacterized membrane protein